MDTTITKKRKADRIESQEVPGGSVNRDGDGNFDLISSLPDELLGTIISLLPTKDGARTQVISRRWQPLWHLAPLNLQVDHCLSSDRERVSVVSKILADHPGPARCFSLHCFRPRHGYAVIDGWLRSKALNGLQDMDFGYESCSRDRSTRHPLLQSALRFSPTLCVVELSYCTFPNQMAQSLNFPCLKQLTLSRVILSEDALNNLLSACPVVQSLLLEWNLGFSHLCISSKTLRTISVCGPCFVENEEFKELVIADAPCLERLLPRGAAGCGPATIRVVRAPKVEILGLVPAGVCRIGPGTTVPQEMISLNLTTSMQTVKVLALVSVGPNLDSVVDFLKCFPCLEKLYMVSELQKTMENKQLYNALDPTECLEHCLKKSGGEELSGHEIRC